MSEQSKKTPENEPEQITITLSKDAKLDQIIDKLEPIWKELHRRENTEFIFFARAHHDQIVTRAAAKPYSFTSYLASQIKAVADLKS